ncbi:MAG: DMT family transporter [Bacillota bacterium]
MILSSQMKGFLFILAADMMWSFSAIVAKFLFNRQMSPFDLVQIRIILSFSILAAYLFLFNRKLLKIDHQDILYMITIGVLGVASVQFTYYLTISQTNVATAIFLQYLAPIFILLYSLAAGKESISPIKLITLICATLGGFLMVKGTPEAGMAVNLPGLLSGLASAIFFAFYTVYGKYGLKKYSPWTVLAWGMGVGGAVWALYNPPWLTFSRYASAGDWLFFVYLAVFATILPFGFFFKGLNYLTPVVAGITSTMEPVLAGILAYLLLGEALTFMQITGCLLILTAVTLLQVKTNPAEKPTAARENTPASHKVWPPSYK